jgi:hypothetical protein
LSGKETIYEDQKLHADAELFAPMFFLFAQGWDYEENVFIGNRFNPDG